MKIYTITCHDVYNFGASLQALALQVFLQNNGYENEIIDYKPDYLDFYYRFSTYVNPNSPYKKLTEKNKLFLLAYSVKRYFSYISSIKRKESFSRFIKQYLKTTRKYLSYQDLKSNPPIAPIYIAGSDQIWNSSTMQNGKDPAFFLQFTPGESKRIAYAASFGSTEINDQLISSIRCWLDSFDAISVREKSSVSLLSQIGVGADHVCDPVFLLSANEWKDLLNINRIPDEKYILIYNLTKPNESLISDARYIAGNNGLKVYSVSPIHINNIDKNFMNVGPKQFVELIFNAECIFTNSFHATAFSIIGQRQFFTYNYHSNSNSSRMKSILEEFNLSHRLNPNNINNDFINAINYRELDNKITESCNRSKTWLLNHIIQ